MIDNYIKLLIVTDKVCYRVGSDYYSTGGFPKEPNALCDRVNVILLAVFKNHNTIHPQWEKIDARVKCLSTGEIRRFGAFPPPIKAIFDIYYLVKQIVKKYEIDVVILKGPSEISLFPIIILRRLQIPSIYHYSLDWLEDVAVSSKKTWFRRVIRPYFFFVIKYRQFLLKAILPKASALATVSSVYEKNLSRYRKGKIYILPSTFTIKTSQIAERKKRGEGICQHRFLFVGRIDRNKNLQLIIRALHLLKNKLPDINIMVDIVGEGGELKAIMRLADSLGVANQLNSIGYVSNNKLIDYYKNAIAILLPSYSETLGKVIIESFAVGTPAIASKVGGVVDIIDDGVNGYFIDPYLPESLADKMEMIIAIQGKTAYDEMSKNCLETAIKFTRETTLQNWIDSINEIIDFKNKKVADR